MLDNTRIRQLAHQHLIGVGDHCIIDFARAVIEEAARSTIAAPAQEPKYADLCNGDAAIFPKGMQRKSEWNTPISTAAPVVPEGDALRLLRAVVAELDEDAPDAPGHSHAIPGKWDRDGSHCEWCATWAAVRSIAAAPSAPAVPEDLPYCTCYTLEQEQYCMEQRKCRKVVAL